MSIYIYKIKTINFSLKIINDTAKIYFRLQGMPSFSLSNHSRIFARFASIACAEINCPSLSQASFDFCTLISGAAKQENPAFLTRITKVRSRRKHI